MATEFNLLPPEYGAAKGLGKVLKVTRALGVISIAFFLIFTIAISAVFLISSASLNALNSDIQTLTAQISAVETSETQIVLLKDRVTKIKSALSLPSADVSLAAIEPLVSNLPENSSLSELSLDSAKTTVALNFTSSADLTSFLNQISTNKNFASVIMTSFTYSLGTGYQVEMSLKQK